MESLSCYSLYKDKITSGIKVSDFESIVTVDASTTVVKNAALETSSMLDAVSKRGLGDFRLSAGTSLTFVHEVTGKTTKSKSGCLLAVDPRVWRLSVDAVPAAMIDPCGLHGHVILFLRANTPYVLSMWDDSTQVVTVKKDGTPEITTVNRASLMRSALANPCPTISKPVRCLVATQ